MNAIAELNDRFRQGDMALGRYKMTSGVMALSPEQQTQLIQLVRDFDSFNVGNDPYSERDFGKVSLDGSNYFWKIDYYDPSYKRHSDDPASKSATRRVMTLMCCDEY